MHVSGPAVLASQSVAALPPREKEDQPERAGEAQKSLY